MTKRYTPEPPDDEKRRAIRRSEADLVSAWDNYAAAIDAAKGGDQMRLVNLLRGIGRWRLTARCSPITLQPFPGGKACCEHRRSASRTLTSLRTSSSL